MARQELRQSNEMHAHVAFSDIFSFLNLFIFINKIICEFHFFISTSQIVEKKIYKDQSMLFHSFVPLILEFVREILIPYLMALALAL